MKSSRSTLAVLTLALCAFLSACTSSHADHDHAAHSAPEIPAATYKSGYGLQLTPAAARFISLETAPLAGRLPASALLRTVKGDFVYVANGDWFLRTAVKLGKSDAAGHEILEGLYDGDVIASAGAGGLWLAELQAINGGVGCAHGH